MPVTRAMARQKDDTIGSNPSFVPISQAKTARSGRTKAKVPTSSTASASKTAKKATDTKEVKEPKPRGRPKKVQEPKATITNSRQRGKAQEETSQEEDEDLQSQESQLEQVQYGQDQHESDHNDESQADTGPEEHGRQQCVTRMSQDLESMQSEAVDDVIDDPDEMLDSFQRAPKHGHGVRFAPSPNTNMIPEDRELEEEEELKEENRIEEQRKSQLRKDLKKLGAKFHPDGAVVTKIKEMSNSGMDMVQSIKAAIEARYKDTIAQLEGGAAPEVKAPTVPNTPLMKTLTSKVGLKRPHSPEQDNLIDDESPLPKSTNANIFSGPSSSTPLPSIPPSFDFQNMEQPKQAQKKLILELPKVIDKELQCSPAKKPKNFDMTYDVNDVREINSFELTDDFDDVNMDISPASPKTIKNPETPVKEMGQMRIGDPEAKQPQAGSSSSQPMKMNEPQIAPSVQPQPNPKILSSVQEESNKSGDDSIIFCEEVIKVPKALSKNTKKLHAAPSEKDKTKQLHVGLIKPKTEPTDKLKSKESKVMVQAKPTEKKMESTETKQDAQQAAPQADEILPKYPVLNTTVTIATATPPQQRQPDATFLLDSPNESFHDAHATFTTAYPTPQGKLDAEPANDELIRPVIPTQTNIMNETVALNKSMTKTPDSKDNYNITLYEDFDEENKHRENKKVPDWATNKNNLNRELLLMGPPYKNFFMKELLVKKDPIFPSHRPNFKLFPDVPSKLRK